MNFATWILWLIGASFLFVGTLPMWEGFRKPAGYQSASYSRQAGKEWECVANWQLEFAATQNDDIEIGVFSVKTPRGTFWSVPGTGRSCIRD